jgi:hypothetical protein
VRLLEASLLGETTAGKRASFDAALELEAEEFMEVLKIH